jgi:hypothetical protein
MHAVRAIRGAWLCESISTGGRGESLSLLTPKIGTGKGLTCGLSLVTKYRSAGKNFLRGFGKECLRSAMHHHSAKGLFALLKGSFRECVMTWPDIRKERIDCVYEMNIGVRALI